MLAPRVSVSDLSSWAGAKSIIYANPRFTTLIRGVLKYTRSFTPSFTARFREKKQIRRRSAPVSEARAGRDSRRATADGRRGRAA